ncbi:hypothetical protein [Wolbachia endosymbiont (group A) of Scambus nigricans]|uniref:hypothetical protein n=1 Tax=Wolbachia endosymbiont (group A) of Scambus nigricans TaxID=2954055 RepID=UPI002230DA3F|nr:hypothetical protein [Wolbachia endosymbiont (group A) of Scambus nigricans]
MLYIALFTIIRTDRNMLLACYSHKHISYRIRTIIRKAIEKSLDSNLYDNMEYLLLSSQWDLLFHFINSLFCSIKQF